MADMRYLKKRREGWAFVHAVPRDLQGRAPFVTKNGKPITKLVQGLGTRDLTAAMAERWVRKAEFDRQIERLRAGEPLTAAEIADEAALAHDTMLFALRSLPRHMVALVPIVDPHSVGD